MITKLDNIDWVKGQINKTVRFNALFYFDDNDFMAIKGFRIMDGYIKLPSVVKGFTEYPVVYLPAKLGASLVDTVLTSQLIMRDYSNIFPLLDRKILIEALSYEKKFSKRDFPNIL
jgi:hypothetical protein